MIGNNNSNSSECLLQIIIIHPLNKPFRMSGKWVLCAETHLTNRGNLHNGRTFDQLSTDRNEDTLYPCLLQIVCGSTQLHLLG